MTRTEAKVLSAIADLGGEASCFQIRDHMNRGGWGWLTGVTVDGAYVALDRLEKRGAVTSRWGEVPPGRRHHPRIYVLSDQPPTYS